MSQENSYYQVQSIRTLRAPRYAVSVASIIKDLINTAPSNITTSVQKINRVPITMPVNDVLKSPSSLKVLQKHFHQNLTILNRNTETGNVASLKAAAVITLQQENLLIENKALVEQSLGDLLNANTIDQAKEKLSSTFDEIKAQHLRIFTNTLSSNIQKASSNIGFTLVETKAVNADLIRVVATNAQGHNLISEIHVDQKKNIDIISELVNITDGSCVKIMDDFNKEMETFGIVSERKERKPTGGIAQMPFAKILQKQNKAMKRQFVNEQVIKKSEKEKAIQFKN